MSEEHLFYLRLLCTALIFFGVGIMAYEYFIHGIASMTPIRIGARMALVGLAGSAVVAIVTWQKSEKEKSGSDTRKK